VCRACDLLARYRAELPQLSGGLGVVVNYVIEFERADATGIVLREALPHMLQEVS